jgi:hypothetical protein
MAGFEPGFIRFSSHLPMKVRPRRIPRETFGTEAVMATRSTTTRGIRAQARPGSKTRHRGAGLPAAGSAAAIREDLVRAARERIANGYYDLPGCIDTAVDRMIDAASRPIAAPAATPGRTAGRRPAR